MTEHVPVPVRRSDGLFRWSAACTCPWTAQASSREDAQRRCDEHAVVIAAEAVLPRAWCDCYEPDDMEYGDNYPCPKCALKQSLVDLSGVKR